MLKAKKNSKNRVAEKKIPPMDSQTPTRNCPEQYIHTLNNTFIICLLFIK